MMKLDREIRKAVETGKVAFGSNSTIRNSKTGKVKLIVLAANCPPENREMIEYNANLSKIPLLTYDGTSTDLATVCGKSFNISALNIKEL